MHPGGIWEFSDSLSGSHAKLQLRKGRRLDLNDKLHGFLIHTAMTTTDLCSLCVVSPLSSKLSLTRPSNRRHSVTVTPPNSISLPDPEYCLAIYEFSEGLRKWRRCSNSTFGVKYLGGSPSRISPTGLAFSHRSGCFAL